MKLTGIFFSVCIMFAMVMFTACDEPEGTLHEVYQNKKELWGEYIRMDTGNTWYIASNYIDGDEYDKSGLKYIKQSANVIRVTKETSSSSLEFYLYASRTPNGSFNGSLESLDDNARSALAGRAAGKGLGSINVTVSNIKDKKNEVETRTNSDGSFEVSGVIPGDGYEITGDGFAIPVYPNNNGEDVGTVTVTGGANLMTSITPASSSSYYSSSNIDMMKLYVGEEYALKIVVENIGTVEAEAARYTLTLPDGLSIIEGKTSGTLGTIELPGQNRISKREIPIKVKCTDITAEYEYKKISIETIDGYDKTWEDSVSLKFNKDNVKFNVVSDGEISWVVIVPNVKAYHDKTKSKYISGKYYYTSEIEVPRYKGDYLIVFSGATAASESTFSFAVDKEADADLDRDYSLSQYAKCTTEADAAIVSPSTDVIYYLSKNKIIYYKVSL